MQPLLSYFLILMLIGIQAKSYFIWDRLFSVVLAPMCEAFFWRGLIHFTHSYNLKHLENIL